MLGKLLKKSSSDVCNPTVKTELHVLLVDDVVNFVISGCKAGSLSYKFGVSVKSQLLNLSYYMISLWNLIYLF